MSRLLRLRGLTSVAAALNVVTTTDSAAAAAKLRDAIVGSKVAASVHEEVVQSFYWWDGQVQNESETRLSFDTLESFSAASDVVLANHNYDTPMVIAPADDDSRYLKGVLQGDAGVAEALAASRLVACAQLSETELSVKTVAAARAAVEAKLHGHKVTWCAASALRQITQVQWAHKRARRMVAGLLFKATSRTSIGSTLKRSYQRRSCSRAASRVWRVDGSV